MIPVGYMAKRIMLWPSDWQKTPAGVEDIYAVSPCMSKYFADYVPLWLHNGYFFFNSLDAVKSLAEEYYVELSGCTFFYYEMYEMQFDGKRKRWEEIKADAESSMKTEVIPLVEKRLEGYDVVCYSRPGGPECSPLSCNGLAGSIAVNRHCLLDSFDEVKRLLEAGAFENSEPGPYRIFAVYTV